MFKAKTLKMQKRTSRLHGLHAWGNSLRFLHLSQSVRRVFCVLGAVILAAYNEKKVMDTIQSRKE